MFGISVFPGMGIDIEKNLDYIKRSSIRGAQYLFTSLHIPEADFHLAESEFIRILTLARDLSMTVIVDISKEYYSNYDWKTYGSIILRLDFGFSDNEIAEISKNHLVQLNASTLDRCHVERLMEMGLITKNLSVSHNYYPRRETGISIELLRERNQYFKSLGIEVMAFTGSENIKRGPLYEGLPTVEAHRGLDILVGAQELLLEGCCAILIGDSMASERELESLLRLKELRGNGDIILLPTTVYPMIEDESLIFNQIHQERMDYSDLVVRSADSRLIKKEKRLKVAKQRSGIRSRGTVTIDNEGYGRYEGELQITRRDLAEDERVNIVGKVEDRGLVISRIRGGTKFLFHKIN